MRMEISKVAKHCRNLEDRREIVSREVQDLRGEKSRSLRPSTLAAMVSERLSMPTASQTIPRVPLGCSEEARLTQGGCRQ